MTKPHFSSLRMDWRTPKAVYQVLDSEFQFDHDPCPANWDGKVDGLTSDWGVQTTSIHLTDVNYRNGLKKATKNGGKAKQSCFYDTRWWHDYCMKATEIRYIKGRLKFDDQPNPAPFPSAIVIFKGNVN